MLMRFARNAITRRPNYTIVHRNWIELPRPTRQFTVTVASRMPSQARKDASKNGEEMEHGRTIEKNGGKENGEEGASKKSKSDAKDCTQHWEDAVHMKDGQEEYKNFKDQDGQQEAEDDHDNENSESNPKKRGRGANQKGSSTSKKQKNGATKDGPRGTAGDKTRVPKKGQKVQWHSLPGYVDGEVVEVVYEEKDVEGKHVKGSKEEPRIVLKSSSSGKIAVHKPDAVYFD